MIVVGLRRQVFLVFFLLFFSNFLFSQHLKIVDAESKKPIPYAKMYFNGKEYYRNTDEYGEIDLEENEVPNKIQSFGYEDFIINSTNNLLLLFITLL